MWLMLTAMMWPMERGSVMLHQFLMETATIVTEESVNQVMIIFIFLSWFEKVKMKSNREGIIQR